MISTYVKDSDMKYTDMCIFIDAHIPELANDDVEPALVEKVYKYLYLLIYALSCKQKYFRDALDYDEFSIVTAGIIYTRLANKRQYLPDDDPKKMKPIKSILNYLNFALYGLKVNYQQENYFGGSHPKYASTDWLEETSRNTVQSYYNDGLEDAIETEISFLPKKINRVLKTTPYRNDPIMLKNLHISLVLSFLNAVTIPSNKYLKIKNNQNEAKQEKALTTLYRKQLSLPPILYHLDESLSDYVILLLRKLKRDFANVLIDTTKSFELPDDVLENIMSSVYDNSRTGDYDE